jgi:hypothetical protein
MLINDHALHHGASVAGKVQSTAICRGARANRSAPIDTLFDW